MGQLNVFARMVVILSSLLVLSSCGSGGSGSIGGGVAEFKTVLVSASSATTLLESDVLTGNTCSITGSSGGTFTTDFLPIVITSSIYPNFTGTASTVAIDGYTITYTPANASSPSLPPANGTTIGDSVLPGGSLTLNIPVAQDSLKYYLVNDKNLQPCSATMYQYYVTITFTGHEFSDPGDEKTFQTSLTVSFADRAS